MRRAALLVAVLAAAAATSIGSAAPATADAAANDPITNIVGGHHVDPGRLGFVAALLNERFRGSDYDKQFCGGTLVGPRTVVTAAHCVTRVGAPSNLSVVVGRNRLSATDGERIGVTRIWIHPGYGRDDVSDVAVLRLASRSAQAPAEVAGPADDRWEVPGFELVTAGWGNTIAQPVSGSNGTAYPDQLRRVRVPVVSDAACEAVYLGLDGESIGPSHSICAGSAGLDSCQGDSGGPLFHKGPKGRYVLVGIVSRGDGCGAPGVPGIYTEVNSPDIAAFIAEHL